MTLAQNIQERGPLQDARGVMSLLQVQRLLEICILILAITQVVWLDTFGRNTLVVIGPVQLQSADLATLLAPLLIVILMLRRIRPPWIVLLFVALYSVSFGRGLLLDKSAAITAFRFDVIFILLMVSVSTNGLDRIGYRTVERVFIVAGLVIAAVSLSRLVYGPNFMIHPGDVDVEITDDWNDGRIIGGASIIVVSLGIMLSIGREFALGVARPKPRFTFLTLFFLAIVALSGQRTASLGLIAALFLVAINRFRQALLILPVAASLLLFAVMTGLINLAPSIENVGQDMGGRTGTFAFRVQIWKGFLRTFRDWPAFDQLFGDPIGARPIFYLPGRIWSASLHSAYLGLVPIIGLLGTILFVIAVLAYFVRAMVHFAQYRRAANYAAPELRVYGAMIMLFYGVSYEWRDVMGVVAGMLFASVTGSREPLEEIPKRKSANSERNLPLEQAKKKLRKRSEPITGFGGGS